MLLRIILPICLAAFMVSCGDDSSSTTINPPLSGLDEKPAVASQPTSIQWLDSAKNYGKINEGQKLALAFRFKNTGAKPLIIQSVQPTCGCTVANFPKEPVAPGQEGEITGEFDSNGREGLQNKHLTVTTNTDPSQQDISFEVNVIAKPKTEDQNQ